MQAADCSSIWFCGSNAEGTKPLIFEQFVIGFLFVYTCLMFVGCESCSKWRRINKRMQRAEES